MILINIKRDDISPNLLSQPSPYLLSQPSPYRDIIHTPLRDRDDEVEPSEAYDEISKYGDQHFTPKLKSNSILSLSIKTSLMLTTHNGIVIVKNNHIHQH